MKYNRTQDDTKGRIIIGVLLIIVLGIVSLFTNKCNAQTGYKYYLFTIAIDQRGNYIAVAEKGAKYDIDTAYAGKKFSNASEIFNALAGAGLEYVNQTSTASFMDASFSSTKIDFFIWRRKIQ
jgi:hypothetical protein